MKNLLWSSSRDHGIPNIPSPPPVPPKRANIMPTTAQTQAAQIHQLEKQIGRMANTITALLETIADRDAQIVAKDERIEQLTADLKNSQLAEEWLRTGRVKGAVIVLNGKRIEPSDKIEVIEWQPMPLEVNGQ